MSAPMPSAPARERRPVEDSNGVPFADYVRTVTFKDVAPPLDDEAPVQIASHVLFDGVAAPCRIGADTTVDLGNRSATIVTLHVQRDDVQIGYRADDGSYVPHLIGGRHVLTIAENEGWEWAPVNPDDPDDPWVVCSFLVARVSIE